VLSPSVCILLLSFCSCSCFFSVFLLVYPFQDDDVYCPVQSSLRLFVRPMYDLSIVCTTTVNNSRDDLQCRNMCGQTDSCLVTDPDPIVRWHGTSFQNTITCVTSCVCVCSHPYLLFVSLFQKYILTHTRCSCSCSSQCMNECHDSVRRMI